MAYDPTWTYDQEEARLYGKPRGLWVSVKGEYDWPTWCEENEFSTSGGIHVEHEVILMPDANVLHISTEEELKEFTLAFGTPHIWAGSVRLGDQYVIDWRQVAAQYDGIIISPYLYRWDQEWMMWYYGWDCASGCIWNLSAIASVSVLTPIKEEA